MTFWRGYLLIGIGLGLALAVLATLSLATPAANGFIHEKIAAGCRSGGEEVVPPGQVREGGMSFVRALRATGTISSIEMTGSNEITVTFDLSKTSKFMSAGFDLTIPDPDGDGPEVDLILSPLPIPDPDFAAHANCKNLRP